MLWCEIYDVKYRDWRPFFDILQFTHCQHICCRRCLSWHPYCFVNITKTTPPRKSPGHQNPPKLLKISATVFLNMCNTAVFISVNVFRTEKQSNLACCILNKMPSHFISCWHCKGKCLFFPKITLNINKTNRREHDCCELLWVTGTTNAHTHLVPCLFRSASQLRFIGSSYFFCKAFCLRPKPRRSLLSASKVIEWNLASIKGKYVNSRCHNAKG